MHKFTTSKANEQGLVSLQQHGLAKVNGTAEAVNSLVMRLDWSEVTCACYVDFSNAFDSIRYNWQILA